MNTIVLFPLNERLTVIRTHKVKLKDGLSGSERVLESLGMITKVGYDRYIELEEGTEINMFAFKAYSSDESYPLVKMKIYTPKKVQTVYVEFESMIGLTWNQTDNQKKVVEIKKKPDFSKISWDREPDERNYFYSNVIGSGRGNLLFKIGDKNPINPIEWNSEEHIQLDNKIGDATVSVRIDENPHTYYLHIYSYCNNDVIKEEKNGFILPVAVCKNFLYAFKVMKDPYASTANYISIPFLSIEELKKGVTDFFKLENKEEFLKLCK